MEYKGASMKKKSITEGTKDGSFFSYDCQIAVIFTFGIGVLQRKDHMVQNPPCWRASSLILPHWDIKTKRPEPVKLDLPLF